MTLAGSDKKTKHLETPDLSVVVASGAGGEFLFRCLESLRNQSQLDRAEVIVIDRCGREVTARVEAGFPFAEVVEVAKPCSIPRLRMLGVQRARGRLVALIEEHCTAPPRWIETICESFGDGDTAIGGPILDDEYRRLRDWVVYFSEYHNYLPPWPEGERYLLNGANIAYRRDSLDGFRDLLDEGYWEVVLHPRLLDSGAIFRSVPDMGVRHTGPFDFLYYLRQRYLLSRAWGGSQRSSAATWKRLLYLFGAPVFPFLLVGRIATRVIESGQNLNKFIFALPLIFGTAIAYVSGEWLGYLKGPGDALEKVE